MAARLFLIVASEGEARDGTAAPRDDAARWPAIERKRFGQRVVAGYI